MNNTSLATIDPTWAWRPYVPSPDAPWNRRRVAHLYRRAGFAATWSQLESGVQSGPAATLDRLFAESPAATEFETESQRMARSVVAGNDVAQLSAWWLYRMAVTPRPLLEQSLLFWHGHFATSGAKVESGLQMHAQFNLLRTHAWGPFEPLVQAISRDPAMLIWLDSTANRKTHPNENYARELMELFCLGVGNYTEHDIQEIARAFTGWEIQYGKFRFTPHHHDAGEKAFLGQRGNFNGDDAVRIVLAQPAAARFIARKLIRYFVCDEPQAPDALVEPLAAELRANELNTGRAIRTILASNLFHSPAAIGRKIRAPVELAIGVLRAFDGRTNFHELHAALDRLGQGVFFPPNVKGWDGGRTWINSATLLGRANLVAALVDREESRFAGSRGLAAVALRDGLTTPAATVDRLAELLVAVPLTPQVRTALLDVAIAAGDDHHRRTRDVLVLLAALPEFQLA